MEKTRRKILCVDDEVRVLEGLEQHLGMDYDLHLATSGAQGLQILRNCGPFAVVVSDMRMPGMDGAAFLQKVRLQSPDSTRILLTGQADLESAIAAVNQGSIFRFLRKPCASPVLLAALEDAIEKHESILRERDLLHNTVNSAATILDKVIRLSADNAELRRLTIIDPLTGIHNRRWFDAEVTRLWWRCQREKRPMSLLMVDIDHFKRFNDAYGHIEGDRCLRAVAEAMVRTVRAATDGVARYGGEEFSVLLPGVTRETGLRIAERIRQAIISEAINHEDAFGVITVSIGGATELPARPWLNAGGASTLVESADEALYAAKMQGRNCVTWKEPEKQHD